MKPALLALLLATAPAFAHATGRNWFLKTHRRAAAHASPARDVSLLALRERAAPKDAAARLPAPKRP